MNRNDSLKTAIKAYTGLLLIVLGTQTAAAQEICANERGEQNGYDYEFWSQAGEGSSCMTLGPGATFSAEWDGITNYLARRGLGYEDMTQTHRQIGWFITDYTVQYNPNCGIQNSNSYMGVYGWALDTADDELVEYYIIEDWCNWIPSMEQNAETMGTINVDGSNYEVIRYRKTNAPSIRMEDGDNFWQYFSIRQNTRNSGSINVSAHFVEWEKLGMELGNLYEVSMLVEGYAGNGDGQGSAVFTSLDVTAGQRVTFGDDAYQVAPGESILLSLDNFGLAGPYPEITVTASNGNVTTSGNLATKQYVTGVYAGTSTITLRGPGGEIWDTATVSVSNSSSLLVRSYEFRALGTRGSEIVRVLLGGSPVNSGYTLSTAYQIYTGKVYGAGEVSVEFVNDDGVQNGRDVRLDYISVGGARRDTEQMADNNAAYANGSCGGGGYTEWLHCNGSVNFGHFDPGHTITVRARGNAGGEHISLLINGQPVNAGWWLGTGYQEYTATVTGDGDINVRFDNDGGLRDAIIDWVKVDDQAPRQAENMQYNTGAFANGRCGGGGYSQWMHCNGVIGFGNISDNLN